EAKIAGKPSPLPYTLDDMARDAVGLLDALGIKKAHIVGVSMGGMIAQLVAADHPEHVLSLTSIMSASGNPEVPFPAKPEAVAKMPPPAPAAHQEAIVANAIKVIRVLAGPDYPPDEKRIRDLVVRSLKRSADRAGMARHNALSSLGLFEDRRAKLKTIKGPPLRVPRGKDPLKAVGGGGGTAADNPGAGRRPLPGLGPDPPDPPPPPTPRSTHPPPPRGPRQDRTDLEPPPLATEQTNPRIRPDPLSLPSPALANWGRPLAITTAAGFIASSAFPVVAGLSKNTESFPKWWGPLDV